MPGTLLGNENVEMRNGEMRNTESSKARSPSGGSDDSEGEQRSQLLTSSYITEICTKIHGNPEMKEKEVGR